MSDHNTFIANQLDHATRLRPAADGDPSQGPYPATVDEVAEEIVAWIEDVDEHSALGLRTAVVRRLIFRLGGTP